jgi:hypothetical protein
MKNAIRIENPDKLLILGTSDEMVETIVENLDLGSIYKRIYIHNITSQDDIDLARKSRLEEGKHVVPVPTFEIKEQFSRIFFRST